MHRFTHASRFEYFLGRTDRWTAWTHTSMVVWRSLSAQGTKLLCIPAVWQQIQQIQMGDFFSESAWTCTPSLWINPNQAADHSNWLFGDVFRQIEAELLTDAWICLPSSSVLLTGNSGTLAHILWSKQESVQSSALRVEVGVYSQFYQILPISQWGFPWFLATFFVNSIDLFDQNKPTAVRLY